MSKQLYKGQIEPELSPSIGEAGDRLIILGRIFQTLEGLSAQDALRLLQTAERYVATRGLLNIENESEPYPPPTDWVIDVVASVFKLDPSLLKQRCRQRHIALPRQVAMYTLWITNTYNYRQIGEALGGRTPGTVFHGCRNVSHLISVDLSLRLKVREILVRVTGKE